MSKGLVSSYVVILIITFRRVTEELLLIIIGKSYAEVKIAILDSGCNTEYQYGVSFVDETIADLNGHGTAIAKIIKEYNPDAKLYIANFKRKWK